MQFLPNIKTMLAKKSRPKSDPNEIGSTGTTIFGGMITDEEYNSKIEGQSGIEIFDKMRRSDSTVAASLMAIELPIRQATWTVNPGSDSSKDIEIAAIVSENLFSGMSIIWDDYIRQALLMLVYGYMVFEKVWKIENSMVLLKKLAPRLPKTIYTWDVEEDGGLESVTQQVYKANGFENVTMPIEKLVIFTNRREGSNFEGISLLRPAWRHWDYKAGFYTIDAIRQERQGVGIPKIYLPEQSKDKAADKETAKKIGANLRAHELAYVVLPPGFEVKFMEMAKGNTNILASVNHHDIGIARSMLVQFLMLGSTSIGSRALGDAFQDFLLLAQQAVAGYIADNMNKYVIKQLVDWNWKVDKYPTLQVGNIAKSNFSSLADAIQKLTGSGMLIPDDNLEDYVREVGRLPAKREVTKPTEPPEPEPPKETCDCPSCGNLKLKELRLENLRQPDEIEKCLLLKEIITETERAKTRIVKAIKSVQDEQLEALAKSVARFGKTAKMKKIGLLSSEIHGELLDIYRFGRVQVKEEIGNQKKRPIRLPVERTQQLADARKRKGKASRRGIVDDQTAKAYIDSKAELVSGQMAKKYENTALFAELEATKQGLSGQAKIAFIGNALRELSDKEAENAARFTVLEAYGIGRNVQAEVQAQDIQFSYYSAIMDENLCEVCEKLDQTVHEFGDPEFTTPNPDCLGGNQCRCVNIHVRKEEEMASV